MSVLGAAINLIGSLPANGDDPMTPEEDASCEHSAHVEEIGEVVCRIEWLMRDAMNAGLSATGPEVGALQSIIDSYRITATAVAGRILEKKLATLQ